MNRTQQFQNWMIKIQNKHYSDDEAMSRAFIKIQEHEENRERN